MATIQAKTSRGHKYWYIVESRRVNGKPRPIVLAYLGKAEDLLVRLQGMTDQFKVKSFSHGGIAALIETARELNVVEIINRHCLDSNTSPPVRHKLTAGITFLLAAIGRVCKPTSKQGWRNWAKTTSLDYLLRKNFDKVDSQHFWDMMDAIPAERLQRIEADLLKEVKKQYQLNSQTLLYDTTNFFTYIHTTNTRNTIAQRGKNKQHRADLRQVGMAMIVNREDHIPLFHLTYQGNRNDSLVFKNLINRIHQRLNELGLQKKSHTMVFDRGNNSKENLQLLRKMKFNYVGALSPYNHREIVEEASANLKTVEVKGTPLQCYRKEHIIWEKKETVIVLISQKLKDGQLRGIYRSIKKKQQLLEELQEKLAKPKARKRNRKSLIKQVKKITNGQHLANVFNWTISVRDEKEGMDAELPETANFMINFSINQDKLNEIEDQLGYRILMTNRKEWSTEDIIESYYSQSSVEHTFRDMKNPAHLAVRPQYHWTDQKIQVHFFICVLGYLMAALVRKKLREKIGYKKSMDSMLEKLNAIRLTTLLEPSKTPGQVKTLFKLEEMDEESKQMMETLNLTDYHKKRPKIRGVGVYKL